MRSLSVKAFSLILLTFIVRFLASCTVDDCGGGATDIRITSFDHFRAIDLAKTMEADTIEFELGFLVDYSYDALAFENTEYSLGIQSANACSPSMTFPINHVIDDSIVVTLNQDIPIANDTIYAGTNLYNNTEHNLTMTYEDWGYGEFVIHPHLEINDYLKTMSEGVFTIYLVTLDGIRYEAQDTVYFNYQ